MKTKGEYRYFREGASLATQLIEEQIKLDMTLDGIQINGWSILPLVEPTVNFLRIMLININNFFLISDTARTSGLLWSWQDDPTLRAGS